MISRMLENYIYFCRRVAVSKFSWWTWPLGLAWFAYNIAYILPGMRQDLIASLLLAAANICFWGDAYRDIKRRGYKLERLHRDG